MRSVCLAGIAWVLISGVCAAQTERLPFKVRAERPRIWVRTDVWEGASVPKLKEWFTLPEYVRRNVKGQAALQYVVNGDGEAGSKAVASLCKMQIGGSSPSCSGASAQKMAAYYDWLRNQPDFTDEKRAPVVAHLEKWGDYFLKYVTTVSAPMYYSRYPGAIGGLAVVGLALHGDSPKADAYILAAYKALKEYGRARQYEGGATAGGIDIYRHAILAERANKDYPKGDDHIKHSNSMIFNDHNQPSTEAKTDIPLDFDRFLDLKKRKGYELASIKAYEATDRYARVLGDLSAAVRQDCQRWTRELVYLGYKYLIVVDRVETLDKPVTQKWLMHFCGETKVEGMLASTVVGNGRLFCQTLLPRDAVLSTQPVGKYTRLVVSPKDDQQRETVYVHVLYPTEAAQEMPPARASVDGKRIAVTVGELSHVFDEPVAGDAPGKAK